MDRKMFETERNTAIPVGLVWSNLLELLYSSCAIRGVSLLPKEVLAGSLLRLSKSRCTSYLTIQLINLDRLWGFKYCHLDLCFIFGVLRSRLSFISSQ